jgi:hypothetical protein
MEIGGPGEGVVDEVAANLVAPRAVEIDGFAPGRAVAIGEIGAELGKVVPFRAEVVVDDIEDDRHAAAMTGVDHPPERVRPTVARLHREGMDAVIAPVARAGELGERHQLDGGDAEVPQIVETLDDRVERAFGRESAHVNFVEKIVLERQAPPSRVAPIEIRVDDGRGAVHAERLEARSGIGAIGAVIRPEEIQAAGSDAFGFDVMVTASGRTHPDPALVRLDDMQFDLLGPRRPDEEFRPPAAENRATELRPRLLAHQPPRFFSMYSRTFAEAIVSAGGPGASRGKEKMGFGRFRGTRLVLHSRATRR